MILHEFSVFKIKLHEFSVVLDYIRDHRFSALFFEQVYFTFFSKEALFTQGLLRVLDQL